MEFYIEIDEQGNPINHPLLAENLFTNYPDGIPTKYQEFTRISRPIPRLFENVSDESKYQKINGIWQDVWVTTSKSDEEISEIKTKIDQEIFLILNGFKEEVVKLITNPLTNDAQKTSYNNYLAELQSYRVTDYENIEIPHIPNLDENGNII